MTQAGPPSFAQQSSANPDVGQALRARREELGWSLAEVAGWLRIKLSYLQALEDGRPQELPGSTYALGFLRSYASGLGLDSEDLARRFRDETKGIARPDLRFPAPVPERGVPAGAAVLLGVVLLGAAYSGWYMLGDQERLPTQTVPPPPAQTVPPPPAQTLPPPPAQTLPPPPAQTLPPPPAMISQGAAPQPSAVPNPAEVRPPAAIASVPAAPAETASPGGTPSEAAGPPPVASPPVASPPAASSGTPPIVPKEQPTIAATPPQTVHSTASAGQEAPAGTATIATTPAVPSSRLSGPSSGQTSGASEPGVPPAVPSPGTLTITASAAAWVQVRKAGGPIIYETILQPGQSWSAPAGSADLLLSTGNAGGVTVSAGGASTPSLGRPGEVRRNLRLSAAAVQDGSLLASSPVSPPSERSPSGQTPPILAGSGARKTPAQKMQPPPGDESDGAQDSGQDGGQPNPEH